MKRLVFLFLLTGPAVMAQLPQGIKCRLGGSDDRPIVCQGAEYPPLRQSAQSVRTNQVVKGDSNVQPQPRPKAAQDSSLLCKQVGQDGKGLKCDDLVFNLVVSAVKQDTPSNEPPAGVDLSDLNSLPMKPEPRLIEESSSRLLSKGGKWLDGRVLSEALIPLRYKELKGGEPISPGMSGCPASAGGSHEESTRVFGVADP